MDVARHARFLKILASPGDRRDLMRGLAAIPMMGAGQALPGIAAAKKNNDAEAERKKRKKATFCLNGHTITAKNRKKKRKLRRRGATPGKCPPNPNPNCVPDSLEVTCETGCLKTTNNCGETVNCDFVNVEPVLTFETQIGVGTQGSGANQLYNP